MKKRARAIPANVRWSRENHPCDAGYETCYAACFDAAVRMANWPERGRRLWESVERIRDERRRARHDAMTDDEKASFCAWAQIVMQTNYLSTVFSALPKSADWPQ